MSNPHYDIEKCLLSLLNTVTINHYSVNDHFEEAKSIQAIAIELFNQGYKFIRSDVISFLLMFRTVNIILKRIFVDEATLRKRKMKKLILDAFTKTVLIVVLINKFMESL